jgi:uncharacterized protein YbjQ (UPF0145 family)
LSASPTPAELAVECLRRPTEHLPHGFYTSDLSIDEAILIRQAGFEVSGLVSGSSVFHTGFVTTNWSTNAEVVELSRAMYSARHAALERLVQASDARADGVVGVRLKIRGVEGWSRGIQFVAIGTAVSDPRSPRAGSAKASSPSPGSPRARSHDASRPFFTSDLSGKDLYLLVEAGYRPLGLVMGCCVYHVAHRSFGQWAKSQRQNVELENFTSALYDARELAMGRMQDEALQHGADGIVGVTTSERPHVWGSNVIEFFAIGTAVEEAGRGHQRVDPKMIMSLDDPVVRTNPGGIVRSSQ